ncbi:MULTISPECIES: PP2C family protein-serine/threonine phosphatase [Sorangium]|uniref:Protein phosphatase 2C domain-containing protein n=1 Tax=Sorangium atrum TaxID=2995308 RepID=A0ABT5C5V5_9BACT|nr:protein phosphatase 2C domain-containing protein [Sorangium aterium]MDC0681806.1 protein phosphatase 2C domain-containing protein [Sorangium aterium]
MNPPLHIEAAGESDVGHQREHNEDSFAVDLDLGLFVVADGIGGAAGGEVASRMAVDIVRSYCKDGEGEITQPTGYDEEVTPLELRLVSSIWRANERIFEVGQRDPLCYGMGTTFAGVYVDGSSACIAHVGDSRVYRYRKHRLERLTEDHSLWNEHLHSGEQLPDDVDPLLARNVVTRALGMGKTVDVATRVERPEAGDLLLICSDGLSGPVSEPEIAELLAQESDLAATARSLIDRANQHGGPDNVTCVLVRWNAGG